MTKKIEEAIEIKSFDYHSKDFFLKPKKDSFHDIDKKVYATANKVGKWVIGIFLAYHALKVLNYLAAILWQSYMPIEVIIPDYFISIVSAIIGFYFGQRFSNGKD